MNENKKILFISNQLSVRPEGGRKNLSILSQEILKKIFKKNFFFYELKKSKTNFLKKIIDFLKGNIDDIDDQKILNLKELLLKKKITHLYLDGSNLGKLSRKLNNKKIKVITFCHNVETNFFLKKLKSGFSVKNFLLLIFNYFAELQTNYFSDYLIFLNKRDKKLMFQYFSKSKHFIVPLSVKDNFKKSKNSINKSKYILFVGSNFFGNSSGLEWYINKIANKINLKTVIVGKNLLRKKFKKNPKISFLGYVKHLNNIYKNALFIVAPIFEGSGMKTKVAESLMYGKHIVGLNEAFVGYEKHEKIIGKKCKSEEQFIEAINKFSKKNFNSFENKLRKIYIENYSEISMKKAYLKIFKII